jgi:hypothetical protein
MTTRKKPTVDRLFVTSYVKKPLERDRALELLDDVVCAWFSRDNTMLEDTVHDIVEFRDGGIFRRPIPTLHNAVGLPFKERVKRKLKQYRLDFFSDF